MGVEEKRAIGKRQLESSIGSILGTTRATTRPVWVVGSVGMTRLMRMVRPVGVARLMRMVWLVGVVWFMGMAWLVGMTWLVEMTWLVGVTWFVWVVWLAGMIRMVGRPGPIGATGLAMAVRVTGPAMMFDFLWLRPISMLVALQFLVGIKTSLEFLSAFYVCWAEVEGIPIRNPWERC